MEWLGVISGLILLPIAANILVASSVLLAKHFSVSKLFISSVIIGLGTSLPELMVSIQANFAGSNQIVIANILGSNIANILLVVGVSALIFPVFTSEKAIYREIVFMMLASLILLALIFYGIVTLILGLMLLMILMIYLGYGYFQDKKQTQNQNQTQTDSKEVNQGGEITYFVKTKNIWVHILLVLFGLVFLLFGADLLVNNAIKIAKIFGLSEAVIGLSLVAVGTSLPELATAIVASFKKQSEVVLGNVIGSCIMNILFILGATSLIQPIVISPIFLKVDIWLVLLSAILLIIPILIKKPIHTFYGILLLILYASYSAYLFGFL